MADKELTACQRCRDQKLKCSRERPRCVRCTRLGYTCVFPNPPNRKMLAAQREKSRLSKSRAATSTSTFKDVSFSLYPTDSLASDIESHASSGADSINALTLPMPVQALFQKVYFTCVFNSSMLFHPPTFYRLFEEGKVPIHNLRAIYAMATTFLEASSSLAKVNAPLLRPLGNLQASAKSWAIEAGKEVLQTIDKPTFHAIRTCQILAMYWFGVGDSERNTMFSGIAYKASRVLKLDDNALGSHINIDKSNPHWLEAETVRRLFWITWFTQGVNADHNFTTNPIDQRINNLALPISETNYYNMVQQPSRCFADLNVPQIQRSDNDYSHNHSIMAEAMCLMVNWVKIRSLILKAESIQKHEWLAQVFALDMQLSTWSARLPSQFKYAKRTIYESLRPEERQTYIIIHVLHAQSRMVLHLSLVPQLGGLNSSSAFPAETISTSTQVALQMAQRISELGSDLLALDWNPVQLPAFFGYCLYVSASVHIVFLSARDTVLANSARSHLLCNLRLIRLMKPYWANLRQLWTRISILYESQRNSIRQRLQGTSDAPTAFQNSLQEISELVHEKRDLAQLREPLANSVLGYTLSGLSPDTNEGVALSHDLERKINLDQHDSTSPNNPQNRRAISDGNFPTKQADVNQNWNFVEPELGEEQPGQVLYDMLPFTHGSNLPGIDWLHWNTIDFQDSMAVDLNVFDYDPSM